MPELIFVSYLGTKCNAGVPEVAMPLIIPESHGALLETFGEESRIVRAMMLEVMVEKKEKGKKQTPWSESASELYRPSDRRLSAK
jgi:hypothetical protein